ncbi:hypothetical protein [Sphingomonas sp. Ant H11]|uniref:hypothetical protein n=1 Tax=Sphingomonas sp. Ant H11 TaxID=1564113 RepID=UPI001E64F575|nr:hypothetical protein [Sphingomonas sp. Ant H11]
MQRAKVGMIGLAAVLLLIGLAAAIFATSVAIGKLPLSVVRVPMLSRRWFPEIPPIRRRSRWPSSASRPVPLPPPAIRAMLLRQRLLLHPFGDAPFTGDFRGKTPRRDRFCRLIPRL